MITKTEYRAMFAADRDAARETVKAWRNAVEALDRIQTADLIAEETPAHTVSLFVNEVGEDLARFVIASLINASAWDGRIYSNVAEWAKGQHSLDEEATMDAMLYSRMHKAHLNQIGQAMMQYQPTTTEDAQEATTEATEAAETEAETDTSTESTKGGEETAPAFTIAHNDQFNSVEVSFSGKPSAEVRDALKALRFRWHGVKRVWYGYATEEAVRAAIEGKSSEKTTNSAEAAPKASKATKATQKAQGTTQDHIRIYYNGIKVDGGRLIRCGYSIDNNAENTPSVSIYARDYDHLPRDLFEVRNESDSYTDYFENDSTYLTPEHPLYKYFRFAAMKAKARDDSKYCEYLRETLNSGKREPWAGHYDNLRADLARREKTLAEFAQMTDPGQPTAEDLEQIDLQRQEAENARKAAEHEEELRQREIYLAQRVHGKRLILAEQEAHPIKADQPIVTIIWSEHPAFSDYEDGELLLSVTAAENILHTLDKEQHETRDTDHGRGWYYKTKFTISGVDFEGEPLEYEGRYDLGDGDGGLVQHIRSFGEWNRTHGPFGQPIENPEESNGTIRFADYLAGLIESEKEREQCEIITLAPADAGCVF
jgi:hypothetical protein